LAKIHTEPALVSRSSSCAGHKKQVIEIQCSSEDLPDCRLWSVVRLIEGKQARSYQVSPCSLSPGESWASFGVDSQTSHLNFDVLFGRLTSVISDLDQRSPARQVMVRKMLTWAAWSIRPLDSQEMFAALATRPQIDILPRCNSNQNENVWSAMDEELISFCPELLEIRPGGQVTFRHEQLRSLIRSPRSADLAFPSADAAHESLAAVCLRHLRCTHQETILRPWIKTIPVFRPERRHCPFRSYCTNHWQDHYRAAETSSRGLVAMLHSTLDSALSSGAASRDLEATNPASRMSMCISICSLWDLKVLGRTYLEMGADVNSSFGSNEAPLHVAGANSSTNMVRLLLDRGADSEVRDKSGLTALQQACRVGASDVATLLLEKGADPNSSLKKTHTSDPVVSTSDRTSVDLPVTYGHSDNAWAIFEAALNPRAPTADPSSTPLHFAVENGSEYVVRYLLDSGANLEAKNALSETALQIAIHKRHDSIVKLLIERGAKRATATGQDKVYIDRVIGGEAIDSALQKFQSLSFKDINSSSQGTDSSETNISRLPAIMTPTSRFDVENIAECGWTMVDKMELEV
jgi:ankyrin repeat protein